MDECSKATRPGPDEGASAELAEARSRLPPPKSPDAESAADPGLETLTLRNEAKRRAVRRRPHAMPPPNGGSEDMQPLERSATAQSASLLQMGGLPFHAVDLLASRVDRILSIGLPALTAALALAFAS